MLFAFNARKAQNAFELDVFCLYLVEVVIIGFRSTDMPRKGILSYVILLS